MADDPASARAQAILAQLELGDWTVLVGPLAEELAAVYADGVRRALTILKLIDGRTSTNEARAQFGLAPVPGGDEIPAIVNQVDERAVAWAQTRAAALVTQIRENTRDMLRATVTRAIAEGWGADRLADEIAQSPGFSRRRAHTIARTEVISANNRGNLDAYRESGVATGKEWLTAHDELVEETCEENEDAGPIGLDDVFPSGDDCPPAHPNCRCALIPVTAPLDPGDAG
jgi:SPP1 gp7 family putative phage head morphogenesis protein